MNEPHVIKKHIFSKGPYIMGVVNVTPDSFYDGGRYAHVDNAIERGVSLLGQGADILDIGGESTRPGAVRVDPAEEMERVLPVIEALSARARWISIDSRNAETLEAALKAGANIINDISALRHDPQSIHIAAEAKVPVLLMHMQGMPKTMQENIKYKNVLEDIAQFFKERINYCRTNRIDDRMLILDPGIGFGKKLEHNLLILSNIRKFYDFGLPLALGVSRKSFIADLSEDEPADERFPGSLAAALWGLSQGVKIFRVHDVGETRQAFKVFQAIQNAES